MLAIELPKIRTVHCRSYAAMLHDYPDYYHQKNQKYDNRKHAPALALGAAFSSISAGMAMSGLMGGLMIAGGIATGLGALTGNKTLSMLGMGMSVVGGVSGAFTDAGGNFVNPFSEGSSFADTQLGQAFSSIKDSVTGSTSGAAPVTQNIADSAGISGQAITEGLSGQNIVGDVATTATTAGSKSGGLLGTLNNNAGTLNAIGGMADAYMQGQAIEANKPVQSAQVNQYNANTAATNAQTDLLNNRYENMQAQNVDVGLNVNQNANIFQNQNASQGGKVATIIDGKVMYLTQAEADALRQRTQSGLLQQGQA